MNLRKKSIAPLAGFAVAVFAECIPPHSYRADISIALLGATWIVVYWLQPNKRE